MLDRKANTMQNASEKQKRYLESIRLEGMKSPEKVHGKTKQDVIDYYKKKGSL